MPKTSFAAKGERTDVHQVITDQFIAAMDTVTGDFRLPWHSKGSALHLPRNVASGRTYQGVNILALWAAGLNRGYEAGTWGTYRQWAAAGAQVQRGEKASTVVFYKQLDPGDPGDEADDGKRSSARFVARASSVFAVEQTDAYTPFFGDEKPAQTEIIDAAEVYMAATGAAISYGGSRAYYDRKADAIQLPLRAAARGTDTSTPVESFYSTALHEIGHWSGAEPRLKREFGKRFGDNAYAAEELVAEFYAAFKCAELGVTNELRADHVQYVKHWKAVMQADNRALFIAAAAASAAVRFTDALQPKLPVSQPETPSPQALP